MHRLPSLLLLAAAVYPADETLLLQRPTLSSSHIVFAYADDLWRVPRSGGEATRLTAGVGVEDNPVFSPDGKWVAFRGEYDGNVDVYVVAAAGGEPKRLTWHPAQDIPVAWTPDGKSIVFRSTRGYSRFMQLYSVSPEGGFESLIDLPMGVQASFSADGKRLAYVPVQSQNSWKKYRGGQATPVWLADMADGRIEKLPRDASNDTCPMWIGNRIYFLSDRNGAVTLYSYDLASKKVAQAVANRGLDIRHASAGPDAIVYEQFGALHLFDLKKNAATPVKVTIGADLPNARPHFVKADKQIRGMNLSPAGVRAVFEAHCEVLTVPAEKGDPRVLTNTPGVCERSPVWSPDGKTVAYFSDESGEYELHLRPQNGLGDARKLKLNGKGFYSNPVWSPDGKKIAFNSNALDLWLIDVESGALTRVDEDYYHDPAAQPTAGWSPDSKWLTYAKVLPNNLRAVFVYSVADAKAHQVSDGLSDARYPVFDANGKYLYFTASTDTGLGTAWLDMSSQERFATRSVYVTVLRKEDPSPVAPESDEEKAADADKAAAKPEAKSEETKKAEAKKEDAKTPETRIDLENIGQRIVALPIPARQYVGLDAGKTGVLFIAEVARGSATPGAVLHKFDLKTRKTEKYAEGIRATTVSANGEKILLRMGDRFVIAGTAAPPKPGEGALKLEAAEIRVDPKQEWKQMYDEVWRIQRDYFYDPGYHGLDLKATAEKYRPYLTQVASRGDLTYLFNEMLGNMTVGHMYVVGGASPEVKRVKVGLLGADYRIENGRYRFARVFSGENWNPQLKAPLTQPGVNVTAGEYLLAVNGRDVRPPGNVYSFFEATADKTTVLRVGPNADGSGSREVTVVPIDSEYALRNRAWVEDNRRKVDQLSGGRLAYVYLPNTAGDGYTYFNRYFFAQVGKEGAVIDERFNGGGQVADYIIDHLNRPLLSYWTTRYGHEFTTPRNAIYGPKVMIVNEFAGSGGDALPWMFRERKLGTIVGKRTWGGLVGILGFPPLMDGGMVTSPNLAFWNPRGQWEVENHGVAPDIEVEYDPAVVRQGRDPQLEKAVEVAMQQLKEKPLPKHKRPAFPNYQAPSLPSGGR